MSARDELARAVNRAMNEVITKRQVTTFDVYCVLGSRVQMMLEKLSPDEKRKCWNGFKNYIDEQCFKETIQ